MGDPQAPLDVFLEVLSRHGLLGDDGMLAADVRLVSLGDHFDWGGTTDRERAAVEGLAILAWLAAHPPDQVELVLGNHDLGRVGELAAFDDVGFARAHAEAVDAYGADPALERSFLERYPALPTAEVAARDFAAFSVAQRELVTALLRAGRFHLAVLGPPGWLLCHAGVTARHLAKLGLSLAEQADAHVVASALERRLQQAIAAWHGEPLALSDLHRPGDAAFGEGAGVLYHRPANPGLARNAGHDFDAELSRRFDPRRLPRGLRQVVGHVADRKCRELLGDWALPEPDAPGRLRHLATDGTLVRYRYGLPPPEPREERAVMVFVDGQMAGTPPADYQLLDLSSLPVA